MNTKKNYFKYVAILLGAIFLVAAAFLVLALWEKGQQDAQVRNEQQGILVYEGKEYIRNDQVETFLVIGLDRYEDSPVSASHGTGVQADFLMLLAFNNQTNQSSAIHINRDAMTKVNKLSVGGASVVGTYDAQIALAYNYVNADNDKIRCRNTVDSVKALLKGVKVDHYFAMTMDAVVASCDVVGGVELTVLDDFTGIDDTLIKGQTVTLTGDQALRYVRTRYGMADSSNSARMARQQQYINALHDKIMEKLDEDESFIIELADTMDDHVVYDSSNQRMQRFMEKFADYEFQGVQELEGESVVGEEFMEFYVDEEAAMEQVIQLMYVPRHD